MSASVCSTASDRIARALRSSACVALAFSAVPNLVTAVFLAPAVAVFASSLPRAFSAVQFRLISVVCCFNAAVSAAICAAVCMVVMVLYLS